MEVLNHGLFISATWPVHKSIRSFTDGRETNRNVRPWQKKRRRQTHRERVVTMRSVKCNRRTRTQPRDKRFNIKNESYAFDKHRFKCNRTEPNRTERAYILALTYQKIMSLNHYYSVFTSLIDNNQTIAFLMLKYQFDVILLSYYHTCIDTVIVVDYS